jgi:glycosyltransferase involved in cell wall biosynthesis
MKVLAIVPSIYDTSPGQRFRIEQWEPILRESGVEITYAPFETPELKSVLHTGGNVAGKVSSVLKNWRARSSDIGRASEFDLIYVFREAALLGPPHFERRLAKSGVPIVFDFDDAIFHLYRSPSNGYLSYLKFPAKTAEICRLSTHIMAGNEYLADYARAENPNVSIVPTTIDTDKYKRPPNVAANDKITIGWSGSFSTVQHLDTIRGMIAELAKEVDFRLRVIGTPDYSIGGVDVESMQWRSDTELEDLSAIDVGLMPLPDEKWSRGKCGLKALQYMALGIPTICSPVGVNSTIIKDGVNGYLADSSSEWIEKIKIMIADAELRRRIGEAGRQTVESEYSAKVVAPKVHAIFKTAASQATRGQIVK